MTRIYAAERPTQVEKEFLNQKEAAALLKCCPRTLRTLTVSGVVPCVRTERRIIYSRTAILKALDKGGAALPVDDADAKKKNAL